MKKCCKVVIGSLFGDEGKGRVVDYLCSQSPNSLVIRFSGGHQAAHRVVHDKYEHIFSNFGSGTLRGNPTYWSKHCTVDPVGLMREFNSLKSLGISPMIYIDAECPIVTPFDIAGNERHEELYRHGSVGVGFGCTIEREENKYSLKYRDLSHDGILVERLGKIKSYYNFDVDWEPDRRFIESCMEIIHSPNITMVDGIPFRSDYIFEGAQGLLLDQNYGFFPNVTRSNTGCKNVVDILGHDDFEIYLVTRAYQTRHGIGFMTNEGRQPVFDEFEESNVENKYQGKFRTALLDTDLLEYAYKRDEYVRKSKNKKLVITCLDHLEKYEFTSRHREYGNLTKDEFVRNISDLLGFREVYCSESDEGEIRKVSGEDEQEEE